MVADLKRMLQTVQNTRVGMRHGALLLLGFAGAFGRAELLGLNVNALDFSRARVAITLRRAKTDQEGAGCRIGIPLWLLREDLPRALTAGLARSCPY